MTRTRAASAAPHDPPLGKVLDFMRLLWSVDHRLQSLSKRMERRIGVTGPQRLALRLAGRFPGVSAGRLAELMAIHPSTLTGILQRLERRGFLERRPDVRDRRRALFRLTARGRRVDELREGTVEAAVGRALRRCGERRQISAEEVLDAIARELELETSSM
jgi:DNA-binding MarR family transcriptional regulator